MNILLSLALLSILIINVFVKEKFRAGDHELLLMPTAYIMPKGISYFSDYELFFLNYTRAFTSRTHIGIFTLFPITTKFLETITIGFKQNYYRASIFELAFWGTYTPKGEGY